jgi:hypothetical protein
MSDPYFDHRLSDCATMEWVGCITLFGAFVAGLIVGLLF